LNIRDNVSQTPGAEEQWPGLDWLQWQSCGETLHMLTQIVGKTRLALTPRQNHWWNVPLYVTARGLSTSVMPLPRGDRLDIEFDFCAHQLTFRHSRGNIDMLPLKAQTVADFYSAYRRILMDLGVQVSINPAPVEVADGIRFDHDTVHRAYDPDAARRFWRILSQSDRVLKKFSTRFCGKISPVHFFWGSFDLAVTRFNGRRAPPRPEADAIQAEAYSHECISAGFWPGNGGYGRAAFYAYAAPVPAGLSEAVIAGPGSFNKALGEFILDYDTLRGAADPQQMLLDFLQATYAACADAAGWDRANLERGNS
jgi:Family of unknown function (DUF5996)